MKAKFIPLLALAVLCGQVNAQLKPQNTIPLSVSDSRELIIQKAAHVVPKPNQLASQKREFIAFVHFGPNTFTRMEWGNGKEDPKIFDLKELHTDQWCQAMKAAGMKMVIITAKHHDGFVLWQSRYTQHGIMSTGFKDGNGDILKELAASCKKYGLKMGVYLSPADLFQIENSEGLYGNLSKYTMRTIPRAVNGRPFANKTTFKFNVDDYNEYFLNQLFELLTEYGPIDEVWFDGAHPKRKGNQQYNYAAWKKLIHTLAPNASVFGREDIRWCGNEAGQTRKTEWNVIPYEQDPDTASHFPDMQQQNLGATENLLKAKFLHYQPAETNTSIREGWFYRDEETQKVRSADDVFDIYERSVGGNSIFLLNIPPNREGKFSAEDVSVLNEVGKRITETYNNNLFKDAKLVPALKDDDLKTAVFLSGSKNQIIIDLPQAVTINRFMVQENVQNGGERVEAHQLEAFVNGAWTKITEATNVGYKRILRFAPIKASKFRFIVTKSRATPAISKIAAYYYQPRPAQLAITHQASGMVEIQPKADDFGWKPHKENAKENLSTGTQVYYTTDGTNPSRQSKIYSAPFMAENTEVKAVAFAGKDMGAVATAKIGYAKETFKVVATDSEEEKFLATDALDGQPKTFWKSKTGNNHFITIDLGKALNISSFLYTPPTGFKEGMLEKGTISFSNDGVTWNNAAIFEFGNLINDPSARAFNLPQAITARFVKISATRIAGDKDRLAIAELDFIAQ